MKRRHNRILLALFLVCSNLLITACGSVSPENGGVSDGRTAGGNTGNSAMMDAPERVYVASYSDVDQMGGSCRYYSFANGFLYYAVMQTEAGGEAHYRFFRQSASGEDSAKELFTDEEAREALSTGVNSFFTDDKGYGYAILRKKPSDGGDAEQYFLCKYGASGSHIFWSEITQEMTGAELDLLKGAAADGEGRIGICKTTEVLCFDEKGILQTRMEVPGEARKIVCGGDGRLYVTYQTRMETVLGVVDFDKKAITEVYRGLPGDGSLFAGEEYDLLLKDQEMLYGYSAGMEAPEALLLWSDLDINEKDIYYLHGLKEGKVLATGRVDGREQMILMKPQGEGSVPEKEVLTLGIIDYDIDYTISALVAAFNRSSEQYRVETILYAKNSTTAQEVTDAVNAANLAIVSGNSPDLICLWRNVDLNIYIKNGILEDLNGYLDQSAALHRENLLEQALQMYTYDDKLYAIPRRVAIDTITGRSRQVGNEGGWTFEEMRQCWQDSSASQLFGHDYSWDVMYNCMQYNLANFVDWETGTCSFDSEEFKAMLEFASQFPLEYPSGVGQDNYEDDSILLMRTPIVSANSLASVRRDFGSDGLTCIGYPVSSGSGTVLVNESSCLFGMSSLSEHKEGAWEFIEFALTNDSAETMENRELGFHVRKDLLERYFVVEMGREYVYDEEGNIARDENGDPLTIQKYEQFGCVPTDEDIVVIKELLDTADIAHDFYDNHIANIIYEESQTYFCGDKTLEQTVDVIQRRAQLYLSENWQP